MSVDGNSGMGVLELAWAERMPALSGTLAFETLDLPSFLSAFGAEDGPAQLSGGIGTDLAHRIDLDLRLSAEHATTGSIALENVAATARVKRGHAAFDVSDASAFGGNVQASIRIDRKPDGDVVEIRFLGEDVDGGIITAFAPLIRILPAAKGNVSATIKAPAGTWSEIVAAAEGTFSANFGEGVVQKLDLRAFLDRLAKGDFFALDEIAKGSLAVKGVEIKAGFSKGVARISKAEIRTANETISVSGIIPSVGGLALSASIAQTSQPQSIPPLSVFFFIGGSWSNPFVVPASTASTGAD